MSMILGLKLPKKILTLFSKWRIIIMRQPYFSNGNKPQFNIFCYVGLSNICPPWKTGSLSKENSIVVTFGSPYLINANFPTVNAAIAMYSDTEQCLRTAAKGILGELPFKGKIPVKLQEIN